MGVMEISDIPGFRDTFNGLRYLEDDEKQTVRIYEMTRDGFMFLAMGFTGSKAARIKESFIEAFNMLEDKVRVLALEERKQITDLLRANSAMLIEQDNTIKELAPKAEAHDRAMDLGDSMTMRNAAKVLGIGCRSIGPTLAHPRLHPGNPQDSWVPDLSRQGQPSGHLCPTSSTSMPCTPTRSVS
jgi:phage regulator Rha-like protein